jgi:hypothetical protein
MKFAWVLSETLQLPPKYQIKQLQDLAPIWGSWRIWRSYHCDHCVCGDQQEAQYCIEHQYYCYCTLYVPDSVETKLPNTFHYGSQGHLTIDNRNDIIAMHLAGSQSDLVMLLGFDYQKCGHVIDAVIDNYTDTQWVFVSNMQQLINDRENFTCDILDNVLTCLN